MSYSKSKKGYAVGLLFTLLVIFISISGVKTVNAQLIGIVQPKATLVDVSETEASEAVQNTFYELMKSGTIDVVAIESRLPIQVMPEAKQKGIQYILYSTLTQTRKKSGGGFLGKITNRVANTVSRNIPYGSNTGEQVARDVAAETLITVSSMANNIKAKDELMLEYKLVNAGDSKVLVSNSVKDVAKENGEDILTKMIESAANEILTNVVSSGVKTNTVKNSPANKTAQNAVQAPVSKELVPFIKVMNDAFAKDYVGKTIRTKVRFVAAGQTQNWVFGAIPANAMKDKMAFRVFDEATNSSEATMGSVLPHIFMNKDNADFIFGLKKGDSLILTGSTVVGTQSLGNGGTYSQIIFVATSIEKAK